MKKSIKFAGALLSFALFVACGHQDVADHSSFA